MKIKINTVADCAYKFIDEFPNLTNSQLAKKVRTTMNSQTTAGCISWYKSKKSKNKITSEVLKEMNNEEDYINNYDEQILDNEAESFFYEYTKNRVALIKKMEPGVGYDFKVLMDNGKEMHIEVKSKKKGKISWLQLTSKETETFLNDKDFHLCIIDQNKTERDILIIERTELFDLMRIKLHARLNGLSAEKKRENWKISNYF